MLVSSAPFYVFLAVVCLSYWLVAGSRPLRMGLLAFANLYFLAHFSLVYLGLPLGAALDFFVGLGLARWKRLAVRRLLLGMSLAVNLGILASLKILPLATGSHWQWLLPLSLSFYCFQSLTYTIDLYLGEIRPTRDFAGYLSAALFFPSITAGPIPRTGNLLTQLDAHFALTTEMGARALLLIGTGLVKKLLIADFLANNLVDRVFDTPALYSSLEIWIAVYAFALQLLFDFSGYTDIARGAGLLLGVELPENFNQPYLSTDISKFWQRWHMTFSRWLFMYLWDPLPKSRKRPVLSYSYSVLLTMILGGLWHGISWNFLIWGTLHGVALSVVFAWKKWRVLPSNAWWANLLGGLLTFHFVCFSWIFFRSGTPQVALSIFRGLWALTWSVENTTPLMAEVLLLAAALLWLPPRWFERITRVASRTPFWVQGLAMAGLVLLIQALAGRGSAPFVYGNF